MTMSGVDRRDLLALGGLAAGGLASGLAGGAQAQPVREKPKTSTLSVAANGRDYPRVPLRKDNIAVTAVQSRVRAVRMGNLKADMRDNLDHMLELIDKANFYGGAQDLLCFHEFPIQGWYPWDRKETIRLSIEIPGPETEEIAKKAKQYNCYIIFGAYVIDKDWPGHFLSITTIIDNTGTVVGKHWKARNIKGVFPGFELITTTIDNVLPRYIEMYGEDAVIPVTRTDIGNIATSSVQRQPELFRAQAMKGAEIFARTASGGFSKDDITMSSAYNGVWSVLVNNAVSPNNPGFFDDAGGGSGGTLICDPRGRIVAEADGKFEQDVDARIPIKSYRDSHRLPDVDTALYLPVFQQYQPRFAPGLFQEYLPADLQDGKKFLSGKDRWK
jgi:predicted amidohydrolase